MAGDGKVGGDLIQWGEDEGTLGETGMGNHEAWFADLEVAEEQDVKVKGAGAVGNARRAVAAIGFFNGEEAIKEGMRGKFCVQGDNRVEKTGLISETDGGSAVERGAAQDTAQGFKLCGRGGKSGFGRTGGAGQVCTHRDVGSPHLSQVTALRWVDGGSGFFEVPKDGAKANKRGG